MEGEVRGTKINAESLSPCTLSPTVKYGVNSDYKV